MNKLFLLCGICLACGCSTKPGPADASHSALSSDAPTIPADGTSTGRLTVTVADARGNLIALAAVQLAASGAAVFAPAAGVTDAKGAFHALVSSTAIGRQDLTARIASVSLHAAVEFVALSLDATMSSLTAEAKTPVADSASSVNVTLRLHDRLDRALAGIAVTIAADHSSVSCGACVSDADGVLIGAVTSRVAGAHHVTATAAGTTLATDVSFVAGPLSANGSRLTVAPAQAPANGTSQVTLTALAADKFGNGLAGQQVGFSVGGTANTLSAPSCTSGADGTCLVSLVSTNAESKSVNATVSGFALVANAVFIPSPGTQSTFGAAPASALADGLASISLNVKLVDHSGQIMPNTAVVLTSSGHDNVFVPAKGKTDSNGLFTAAFFSTRPEAKTVSASAVDAVLPASVTFLPPPWVNVTHDLFGAGVSSIAFGANVAYAGVVGGLCASHDGGHTWTCQRDALSPSSSMVVDPRDDATVVGGDGYQLIRTSDAGAHWDILPRGWSSFCSVTGVVIHPLTPTTIYVAVNCFGNPGGGVYRSTDDGAKFSLLPGLPQNVADVALQPETPSNVVAADRSNGIWWSADGGDSWTAATGLLTRTAYSVVFDPTSPNRLYATGSWNGIARSVDGGRTWDELLSPPILYAARVDPHTGFVYAAGFNDAGGLTGVMVSKNQGSTWLNTALTGVAPATMSAFAVDPTHAGTLLFGGTILEQQGVWRTDDGAASVAYSSSGIEMLSAHGVLADPASTNGAIMLAQGPQVTADAGATWSSAGTGLPADQYLSLARDPATPSRLFVAVLNSGIYRSTDSGATFASAGLQGQFAQVTALGGRVFAVEPAWGAKPNHVHASDATMLSWSDLAGVQAYCVAGAPANPPTLYASFGAKFFRSQDAGQSWTVQTSTFPGHGQAVDVEVDPSVTNTVYVLTNSSEIYRSVDAGATWNPIIVGGAVRAIAIDPTNSSVLYVVPGNKGVTKSIDAGATWSDAAADGLWGYPKAISISPVDPKVIWIASESGGVFRTTTAGQ